MESLKIYLEIPKRESVHGKQDSRIQEKKKRIKSTSIHEEEEEEVEEEEEQSAIRKFKRSDFFTSSDEKFYNFQKIFENFIQKENNDDTFKNYSSFVYFLNNAYDNDY